MLLSLSVFQMTMMYCIWTAWSCAALPTYLLTYTHKTHLSSFQLAIINQWQVTQMLTSCYLTTFNQALYFPCGFCCYILWLNNLAGHFVAKNSNCFPIEAQAYQSSASKPQCHWWSESWWKQSYWLSGSL